MDKALRFYEAVKWAEKNGITGGIGSGLFGPNNDCTCTQIVTLIPPRRGRVPIRYAPSPFYCLYMSDPHSVSNRSAMPFRAMESLFPKGEDRISSAHIGGKGLID